MTKSLKEKCQSPDRKVPSHPGLGLQIQVAVQHKHSSTQDQREHPGIQTQQWCQHESTSCQSLSSLV